MQFIDHPKFSALEETICLLFPVKIMVKLYTKAWLSHHKPLIGSQFYRNINTNNKTSNLIHIRLPHTSEASKNILTFNGNHCHNTARPQNSLNPSLGHRNARQLRRSVALRRRARIYWAGDYGEPATARATDYENGNSNTFITLILQIGLNNDVPNHCFPPLFAEPLNVPTTSSVLIN